MTTEAGPGAHSSLVGGSTAQRRMECPGSYQLELKAPKKPSSKYADEGTMLHGVMERILGDGKTVEEMIGYEELGHVLTEDLADEMIRPALNCWEQIVECYGITEYLTEVRVSYLDHPGAFGTCDVLGHGEEYTLKLDWKFGRGVPVSAEGNTQLRFYAGAARQTIDVYDMFAPHKDIVLCIVQPAMDEPWTVDIIDNEELDDFVLRLGDAIKLLESGEADDQYNGGSWCRWCGGAPLCPEKKSDAQLLLETTREKMQTMFPDEIGDLVTLAEEASEWAKQVMGFAHGELEKGNEVTGRKLVRKRATRQWRDKDAAEELLRQHLNDIHEVKLISPAQAEKKLKGSKVDLSEIVVSKSTGTSMTVATDPRPAVTGRYDGSALALPPSNVHEEEI